MRPNLHACEIVPGNCARSSSSSVQRRQLLLAALASGIGGVAVDVRAAEFDVLQYQGKVLYLDFWASWCAPCQESFPYMNWLVADFSGRGLSVVAVNVDHDRERANAFLRRFGGRVPIVFDPSGAIAARFRVQAMPTSLLLDRSGRVRFTHAGFFPDRLSQYDNQITQLLAEH